MDKRTLTVLKGSIKKWEGIVAGTIEDKGIENCPLCKEFYDDDCEGCPVADRTGQIHCLGSPYEEYCLGSNSKQQSAQAELDFLRSLLPENF